MKEVLLTGTAGFIGFHTAIKFIKEGYKVTGVDDINDHYDPMIKEKRLKHLQENYKDFFDFHKIDIRDKSKVDSILKEKKYDAVINLAARAGVRNSVVNPWVYYDTNTIGVLNILNSMKEYQPNALLIQASTSSVYGNNEVPFREDDRVDKPLSPYSASKKAAEEICYTYNYLSGINVLIFRFFTVYGTYGRPDMSIFRFIKWIDEEAELKLYGDGSQERDFTYVEDIANAIYKGLGFKGYDIINLGNDNPTKINTVIQEIEKNLNKKVKITSLDRHPADILYTCAKIEKAKKILNWEPDTKIDQGLKVVIDWYLKEKEWVKDINIGE